MRWVAAQPQNAAKPAAASAPSVQRRGGFVVVERALRNLGIEVPGHDIEPRQGASGRHRLKLLAQPLGAVDRLRHILAALTRQRVGIVLEPAQSLRRREVLAPRLGVELGDDPIELRRARRPGAAGIAARIPALASRSVRQAQRPPRQTCAQTLAVPYALPEWIAVSGAAVERAARRGAILPTIEWRYGVGTIREPARATSGRSNRSRGLHWRTFPSASSPYPIAPSQGVYEDKGGPGIEAALAELLMSPWRPERQARARRAAGDRGGAGRARRPRPLPADPDHGRHRARAARRDAGSDRSGLRPAAARLRRTDAVRRASPKCRPRFCRARSPGTRGSSLIINLPGKPAAIRTCLDAVFAAVPYCIDLIGGAAARDQPALLQGVPAEGVRASAECRGETGATSARFGVKGSPIMSVAVQIKEPETDVRAAMREIGRRARAAARELANAPAETEEPRASCRGAALARARPPQFSPPTRSISRRRGRRT